MISQVYQRLQRFWNEQPLLSVVFLAAFFRLLAVIFSKGWGMHDDHFLIIESSQSWVDGFDYNNWLPGDKTIDQPTPSGHSLFYTGFHYLLFLFLKFIGLLNPQGKMIVVRLLHAIASMIVVVYGYKIAEKISNAKTAQIVGLLLGIYWFAPMLSVRNLVEVACVPFLIYSTWLLLICKDNTKQLILAGFIAGLAFSVRFQALFFLFGMGLSLILTKRFKAAFWFGTFCLLAIAAVQGITDYIIWNKPFVEFTEYVNYNIANATAYFNKPWYMYFILVFGLLVPPISLFLIFGYIRSWKKHLLLFLPAFIFFAFHSYFPNKQERFIYPFIPFMIILGYVGWAEFWQQSSFWAKRKSLYRGFWIFFGIVNGITLCFLSVTYSKRCRVEAMVWLSNQKDFKNLIVEDSNRDDFLISPRFYLGKWDFAEWGVTSVTPIDSVYTGAMRSDLRRRPNYAIFYQEENLAERTARFKKYYPNLKYQATIEPSFMDVVLHKLNKKNKNQVCFIYKLE